MKELLKDICEIRTGYTIREALFNDVNGNINVVQMRDISDYNELLPTTKKHTISEKQIRLQKLYNGDLLLITKGIKNNTIVFESDIPHISTSTFIVLTPKIKDYYNPHYLAWFMNSSYGQKQIEAIRKGTALLVGDVNEIEVVLPNMEKQNKIAKTYAIIKKKEILHKQLIQKEKELLEGIL